MAKAAAGAAVIVLSVGDPDFATPAAVVAAAKAALDAGRTHYGSIRGEPALLAALAGRLSTAWCRDVSVDEVIPTAGAQNALFAVAQCLVEPGDEVVVLEPCYVTYEGALGAAGATMTAAPLHRQRGFHIDAADVAAAVTPRTRAILINTPHNPTGAVMTRDEVAAVVAIARQHDVWLISDEVYADQTFERPMASAGACVHDPHHDKIVVVGSLSKSHAMTGWRIGYVAGPPDLVRHIYNLNLCMLYGISPFIQDAAIVALDQHLAVHSMRDELMRRRDTVCAALADLAPVVNVLKPEAGMFVLLDVSASGLSPFDYAAGLLEQHLVSLLPADSFGKSAEGLIRLALTVNVDTLAEVCKRIRAYTQSISTQLPSQAPQ